MPALGLTLLLIYGLLAVGVRMVVQVHRTGSTGFAGMRGAPVSVERLAGVLLAVAVLLCLAGTTLELAGVLGSISVLDSDLASVLGAALACLGIAITAIAQFAMGDAWRVGVDPSERTELVTNGPFALVRNPIYAAMIPAFGGFALLSPNAVTIAGAVLLLIALQLQTRFVEEPFLLAVHGGRYAGYSARTGRFLPRLGRLRANS
jgi:protein-S-isoprenylcysteine O-methyltransferase Ste14